MNIKNLRKNKKGFTLIEIIVVVVILAVLLAVAVPSVLKYMGEADDVKYMSQARGAMITAQAEATKDWANAKATDAALPTSWTADADEIASITGTPKVTSFTAEIASTGEVTKVEVNFEDKKATVTTNGTVVLEDVTTTEP